MLATSAPIQNRYSFFRKITGINSNKLKSFQSYGKNVPFNAEVSEKCTSSKNLDDNEVNDGSFVSCHHPNDGF